MFDFLHKNKISVIIFTIALIARAVLFFINLDAHNGNFEETIHGSDWYFEVANNLASGNGFSLDGINPSPIHVPIYPLFLAFSLFVFGSYKFAVIVQMLLGSMIPVLGRILSLKIIQSEKIGLVVGIILALEPNFLLLSSIFFTETIFIFLFLLFVLIFIKYLENPKYKALVLSAVILGISSLTKTVVQFLPVFILPIMIFYLRGKMSIKKIFSNFLIFTVLFVVVLSPWLYRNYRVFGAPGMTIMPALNLYATLVPSVLATAEHTTFSQARKSFIDDRNIDVSALNFSTASRFNKEAIGVISKHPIAIVQVTVINVFTFFTHDGMLTVLENAGITPKSYLSKPAIEILFDSPFEFAKVVMKYSTSPFILILIMRLFWLGVLISFLVGSWLLYRRKMLNVSISFCLALVLYFALTTPSNGLTVNGRFRMPVVPIVLAIGLYPFLSKKENRNALIK